MAAPASAAQSTVSFFEQQDSPSKQPDSNSSKLEKALRFFSKLDSATKMRGNVKLLLAVDDIRHHSMNIGLEPSQITALVNIILNSNSKLSQAIRSKFIKCLVPSSQVPQEAVVRVLAHISSKIFTGAGPSNLHSLLLRWILLIFDHIDGYEQLHKLYNVIFCFINSHRLLPHACHLLFLLTTKQDVRLFRVHKLLEVTKSVGPEPYILGLLMIYKVYCPHLVAMKLEFSHKVFFKAHDVAWRSTIETVIKQRAATEDLDARRRASQIQSRREKGRGHPRSKRQKLMIPDSHSAAHEVNLESSAASDHGLDVTDTIPYEQIESFTSFLEVIDRIEFPSQVAACLGDPRLQLLLICNPDPLLLARLCFWIQHIFVFGFKRTERGCEERNGQLLHLLFTLSRQLPGLPVVFGFLESWLPTWDGQAYAPLIFSLISCVRPTSYNEFHCSILEPVQRIFFSSDVYTKTMCIAALTKLMHNLAIEERSRPDCSPDASLAAGTWQPRQEATDGDVSGMNEKEKRLMAGAAAAASCAGSVCDILCRMISFLDVVIVLGMRMEDDHYLLQMSSLDLLQLISELFLKYNVPLVCLPMRLLHRLMLSDCCSTLARLCGIINTFRETFVVLKSSGSKSGSSSSNTLAGGGGGGGGGGAAAVVGTTTVDLACNKSLNVATNRFNSLLLDVLGMLWQGRMFSNRKHNYESIFSVRLSPGLESQITNNALTIYTGPAFLGLAYRFLTETQREGKRVHPTQIEQFKEIYLQFLQLENFPEFMQLVNTNIKRHKSKHSDITNLD